MHGVNFALEAIGGRIAEDEQLRTEITTYRATRPASRTYLCGSAQHAALMALAMLRCSSEGVIECH